MCASPPPDEFEEGADRQLALRIWPCEIELVELRPMTPCGGPSLSPVDSLAVLLREGRQPPGGLLQLTKGFESTYAWPLQSMMTQLSYLSSRTLLMSPMTH